MARKAKVTLDQKQNQSDVNRDVNLPDEDQTDEDQTDEDQSTEDQTDEDQSNGDEQDVGAPEPGEATATLTLNDTDAGKLLAEYFGADTLEFTIFDYLGAPDTFVAQIEIDGDTFTSDPMEDPRVAALDTLRRIPEIAEANIRVGEAVGDWKYERPASGANATQADPWEEGQPDADKLQKLGTGIADRLREIAGRDFDNRGSMLALAGSMAEAKAMIAARSVKGKGGVDKHAWGKYANAFFPDFLTMYPGKNSLSEAVELGSAPEAVTDLWPLGQTSPKSFQGWLAEARGWIRDVGGRAVLSETGVSKAIDEWIAGERSGPAPEAPGRGAVLEAIRAGVVQELLVKVKLEKERGYEAARTQKNTAEAAKYDKARNALRTALPVADWKIGELPEDMKAAETNPTFKLILKGVENAYNEKVRTTEEKEAAKVAATAEKLKEAFADKSVDVAAQHLLNILVSHPEPEAVLEAMQAGLQRHLDAEAEKQRLEAEAGDTELDGDGDMGDADDLPEDEEGDTSEAAE